MSPPSGRAAAVLAGEFLSGRLTQVDVPRINRELAELWAAAAAHEDDGSHMAVARACVLNLILYSSDDDAESSVGELIDEVTSRHPCRVLLAIARAGERPELEAWVSARCHLPAPGATRQICCEQITVRWQGQGCRQLPSVVLPLLVPDLPVFLWWRAGELDHEALDPFVGSVDRLIVDSERWESGLEGFKDVVRCMHDYREPPVVSDLSWRRLLAWREALASAFDICGTELTAFDLAGLEAVEIEHGSPSSAQAALLTGWLASRLSWEPATFVGEADGNFEMSFALEGDPVRVSWRREPAGEAPPAGLIRVKLTMAGERALTVSLQGRERKPFLVVTASSATGQCREVMSRGPVTGEATVVGQELDVFARSKTFEDAVRMVVRLTERRGRE